MLKLVTIVGARPQFVKAAVVSREIRCRSDAQEILVHTGQHYDENMSDVFFSEMDIPSPDYNLGIGSGNQGDQTGRMLGAIEAVLLSEKPDWVLVYGDTNSTLAGALAAVKLHIPVAHVEAGLRSFNRKMPEEINRILTDHSSDLLFAPTTTAVENLKNEGIPQRRIQLVGDVMYDAALYYGHKAEASSAILSQLKLEPRSYVLSTVHRAENTDNDVRLRIIFAALNNISQQIPVVVPLHPRTRARLENLEIPTPNISIVEPLGYLDMVMLEKNSCAIATDSGGVQKEAFFFGVPCVTLRDETEWVETVDIGANRLATPLSAESVQAAVTAALTSQKPAPSSLYGEGNAASKILSSLLNETVEEDTNRS